MMMLFMCPFGFGLGNVLAMKLFDANDNYQPSNEFKVILKISVNK